MLARLAPAAPLSATALCRAAGIALALAGLACFGYLLWTPLPRPAAPPAVAQAQDDGQARAISQWLAPGPEQLDVKVTGALVGSARGGVVLSVNGGPARAYAVGENVSQYVVLDRIDADAVVLDQDGKTVRVPMPAQPPLPENAITPTAGR